jgi:hypothetical protein
MPPAAKGKVAKKAANSKASPTAKLIAIEANRIACNEMNQVIQSRPPRPCTMGRDVGKSALISQSPLWTSSPVAAGSNTRTRKKKC